MLCRSRGVIEGVSVRPRKKALRIPEKGLKKESERQELPGLG